MTSTGTVSLMIDGQRVTVDRGTTVFGMRRAWPGSRYRFSVISKMKGPSEYAVSAASIQASGP